MPNFSPSSAKTTVAPGPALGQPPQELVGRVRLLERDRVAERLGAGEDLEQPAVVLGQVVAEEVVSPSSRRAGSGSRRGRCTRCPPRRSPRPGAAPRPARRPTSRGPGAEELLEIGRVSRGSARPGRGAGIIVRIGSKNPPPRISTRPASTSAAHPRDVFGLLLDQPFQQRARGVQDERDLGIALEHVEERQVAVAIRRLEDAVEVADGLMVVQGEDQADAATCDDPRETAARANDSRTGAQRDRRDSPDGATATRPARIARLHESLGHCDRRRLDR